MDKFDEMVEALEDNEDLVECQECFDLFPKADCVKQTHGYVCPTCHSQISIVDSEPEKDIEFPEITTGLYDHEFPDITEYAPGTVKDWDAEPTVMDALDALIADEIEAIDGYEEAEEIIEASDHEDKEELLKTIEHIKEEEEEHIEELKDDCPECEVPTEAEVEDKTEAKESEESADTPVEEADCTKHKAITHSEEEKTELKETYEKLFEQKLDEEALNEIWPFDGKKKVRNEVDSVFSNGYMVYALPSKAKHEAATIEKAVELCKAMSKKAPKDKVFIFPKAIPDAQLKGYDPELQKLIDQKNDFAAAIMTMQNGKSLEDKIKSFAKFKQNIDKQNEIINNAASNERSGIDARAGLAADEVPAEATETADADLEDPIEEARGKALETLGTKESADKYTEESYAKYSAKYDDYLAKIKAAKKLETLTDRYIPQLPRLVEKIKALLEEKPVDTEPETEVTDDKTDGVDTTAGDSSAKPEDTKEAKAKKKKENSEIRSALRAAGMSEVAIQKLFDKGAIRAIRKAFGEGLNITTENLESILTESVEEADKTATPIREEYHKYANPAELKAMEDLEAVIDTAKYKVLNTMNSWGIDITESDGQGWMSGNNEYTYQVMVDYKGIDKDEEEDIQDQLLNMIESEILTNYKLPAEISKVACSVRLPDPDIAYDDESQSVTRGSILIYVTFARNLI